MNARQVRLTKRGNCFYLRSVVPKDWQTIISAREIKLALGTTDPRCATLRSRSLSNSFDRFFRKEHMMRFASLPDINAEVKLYFQKALNEAMEASFDLVADGSDLSHEIELYKSSLAQYRTSLAQKQLPGLLNIDASEIAGKLADDGKRLDQDAKRYLGAMIVRARIQATTYALNELTGGEIPYENQHALFFGMIPSRFPGIEDGADRSRSQVQSYSAADPQLEHEWRCQCHQTGSNNPRYLAEKRSKSGRLAVEVNL